MQSSGVHLAGDCHFQVCTHSPLCHNDNFSLEWLGLVSGVCPAEYTSAFPSLPAIPESRRAPQDTRDLLVNPFISCRLDSEGAEKAGKRALSWRHPNTADASRGGRAKRWGTEHLLRCPSTINQALPAPSLQLSVPPSSCSLMSSDTWRRPEAETSYHNVFVTRQITNVWETAVCFSCTDGAILQPVL